MSYVSVSDWAALPASAAVNTAVSPSVTATFEIVSEAVPSTPASSSLMVPVAVPSRMAAPLALRRVTVNVSVDSWTLSFTVRTWIASSCRPAGNVSVPESAT